jgi:hypothetical protein
MRQFYTFGTETDTRLWTETFTVTFMIQLSH